MRVPKLLSGSGIVLSLFAPVVLAGCYVKVGKSSNGSDKDVEVHSPLGGLHVRKTVPTAEDVGLPTYPSATPVAGQDGEDGADVNVGFGSWQLRVSVAKYHTSDAQAKVETFYRAALARYGEVIECRDGHAVGTPAMTRDGLGCSERQPSSKGIHIDKDEMDLNLRAGSKRHQHIVGFSEHSGGDTRFALLRLDLPAAIEEGNTVE